MAALATAILRGATSHEHLDEILSRGGEIADMSFRDPLGRSLAHMSSACGDVRALRWLRLRGADFRSTTTTGGDTILHLAAAERHLEAVTYLLDEAGVELAGVNSAGDSALDVAIKSGFDEIARVMTRHLRPPPPAAPPAKTEDSSCSTIETSETCPPPPSARGKLTGGNPISSQTSRVSSQDVTIAAGRQPRVAHKGSQTAKSMTTTSAAVAAKATPRTPPLGGRSVTSGGFFVAGAWSKAGACSCFNIRHLHLLGKHGIVFDMGVCPPQVVHVQHVFVTHGHLDHCGAIVSHARLRKVSRQAPAKYFMHAGLTEGMDKVRRAFEAVNGDSIPMDIVAVGANDSVDLGQGCFVRPFLVEHRVEALGFALIRRRADGLKEEFRQMDGKTLGQLKKKGVQICRYCETVEVAYTGDTVMSPLLSLPQVWDARLLIMEVTYMDGDRTAAETNFHIHIQDLLDSLEKLEGVEQLVVAHVSERHGNYLSVLNLLAATLPPSILHKVLVALGEFGAPAYLSFLEDFVAGNAQCAAASAESSGPG